MNPVLGFLQHFYHSALRKSKQEWEIVLYCIGIATLFWFLNAMGKTYHHTLEVPVQYDYPRNRYLAIASLPNTWKVQVEGRGWDLARAIWDWEQLPLRIRIQKPLETPYLLPQAWTQKTRDLLPAVKVEAIAEDTLFCRFDRIDKKLVGLYVDLQEIRLRPGFQIASPIQLTPRFVEFKGAASLIRNLPSMLPVKIDARNINESFDQNVALDFSSEYPRNALLNYELDAVNVQFSVRPSLEDEMEIAIEPIHGESTRGLFLKERKVLITFLVSDKEKKNIRPSDFRVVADMASFNPADSTVEVRLESKPRSVSDVQLGISKTRVYAR